jgi:hypothetical protein
MVTTEQRIAKLEDQVHALTQALHLLTVSHAPTSKWLDATMKRIDNEHHEHDARCAVDRPCPDDL